MKKHQEQFKCRNPTFCWQASFWWTADKTLFMRMATGKHHSFWWYDVTAFPILALIHAATFMSTGKTSCKHLLRQSDHRLEWIIVDSHISAFFLLLSYFHSCAVKIANSLRWLFVRCSTQQLNKVYNAVQRMGIWPAILNLLYWCKQTWQYLPQTCCSIKKKTKKLHQ